MKKVFLSLLSFAMLLLFSVQSATAQPIAYTSPPPDDNLPPTVFSLFDPNYDYLINGGSSVSNIGNSKISISGFSTAKKRVDTIGVQLTLQRWTGSSWVDIYRSPRTESSSSSNIYSEHEVAVAPGYYYRSKSYHWTQHGTITEDGTTYSGSILIPDK